MNTPIRKTFQRHTPLKRLTGFVLVCLLTAMQFNAAAQKVMNQPATTNTPPAMPEDISPLLIGEQIPAMVLPDKDGNLFNVNKAVMEKPTILVFYRGGWCPFCTKQLSGLQDINTDLNKKGFQVIAVSTDAPEMLKNAATKEKLEYTLLSDADLNLAQKFGIAFKAPESYASLLTKNSGGKDKDLLLPVPSVFILDKKGAIRFEYINPDFKQRISSSLLLAAAQALYDEL
ncbi:peroxiredoxin-like family protein [Chitinophaga arvensicola]|nr:peroxiredoxin-like family protein [Chitinophaga arvensicola]